MLTLLATTLTTSEAYAAKSSSAKPKPKPKPGATGKDMSPLEKVEKIVSIGQNVFSAANAVWVGVSGKDGEAWTIPTQSRSLYLRLSISSSMFTCAPSP